MKVLRKWQTLQSSDGHVDFKSERPLQMSVDNTNKSVESGLLSVDGGWQTLTVESCLLMYSRGRGYENRAILKKCSKFRWFLKIV
jgi:hypothetical protein